jgi:hypothetical protein
MQRILKNILLVGALVSGMTGWAAQGQQISVDQAIDRVSQREAQLTRTLRQYTPTIETYVQDMRPDNDLGMTTVTDHYFLAKALLSQDKVEAPPTVKDLQKPKKKGEKPHQVNLGGLSGVFPSESVQDGFLRMIYVDPEGSFDRQHYHFDYVRREFLGEVRCLVFDVTPQQGLKGDHFLGRIWVEDQDYTIVRFNGADVPDEHPKGYRLHFDSWRVNVAPGIWVPSYIYSAESDVHDLMWSHVRFRAQTRLWGYNIRRTIGEADRSQAESQRAREREAEDKAMDRLQTAGLLAPAGEVDKILATVVNNLQVSNNLDIEPEVECHVLLTSTLESFTIGHTIVVSRGLLDVLPDEASLAAILAHELGHVLTGQSFRDEWALSDWNVFPTEEGFNHFDLPIDQHKEELANQKSVELLTKSPYKDKMWGAGKFLQVLDGQSKTLPNLISPHLESRAVVANQLMNAAPHPATNSASDVAVLAMGSRIKLDPWTDQVDVLKSKPVALLTRQEQQPFQIGPYMPYLYRQTATGGGVQKAPAKSSGNGEQ